MKNHRNILGFDDRWFMVIGIPIISLIVTAILFSNKLPTDLYGFLMKCYPVSLFYCTLYWTCFRFIIIRFHKKYPEQEDAGKRILYGSLLILLCYTIINRLISFTIEPYLHDFANVKESHAILEIISSLLIGSLVISIYEGVYFAKKLHVTQIEKEQLRTENIQSQLEGLKNQVNPHFLFNSLNTLSSIIPEDSEKAVSFVQKLSKVYRYILEIREKQIISLDEELEYVQAYSYLLNERFGDNLKIIVAVDERYKDFKILPLSLQLLIENAIKHNIISSAKPLTIRISVENGEKLIVKNNLQKKNQVVHSTKAGLQNIQNRYKFLTKESVDIMETSSAFIVALPIISKFNIAMS